MISAAELTSLATTNDIISIGVLADDLRRGRHGLKTTFVRVATTVADAGALVHRPLSAGELRIVGAPTGRAFRVPTIAVFFFAGDRITNERVYLDVASLLTQIGRVDVLAAAQPS